VRRSQRALSRDLTDRFKPSVTHYSLEYLNTAGRFSPQQILKSFRRRAKGSVLLYGPPGTGKTQFTEHLASELKLPLVSKSAAALLSKWLGDSEKNIAAAYIAQLSKAGVFRQPIVTRVDHLRGFYPAESYHQDYLVHNPSSSYIVYNDLPKIESLKRVFPGYYSDRPVLLAQASSH